MPGTEKNSLLCFTQSFCFTVNIILRRKHDQVWEFQVEKMAYMASLAWIFFFTLYPITFLIENRSLNTNKYIHIQVSDLLLMLLLRLIWLFLILLNLAAILCLKFGKKSATEYNSYARALYQLLYISILVLRIWGNPSYDDIDWLMALIIHLFKAGVNTNLSETVGSLKRD